MSALWAHPRLRDTGTRPYVFDTHRRWAVVLVHAGWLSVGAALLLSAASVYSIDVAQRASTAETGSFAGDALKQLGVRIAMDDFGTGYSSLSYLQKFPFDKIKIDRSFVADLGPGKGAGAAAIVRAVVSLGSSLGMTTTAEGIEAEAQAAFLRAEGCDEVQGYHYGRPMPAADLTRLLARSGGIAGHAQPACRPSGKTTAPASLEPAG